MCRKNSVWVKLDLHTDDVLAVAHTQKELAELCGVKESSIRESISRAKRQGWRCCYTRLCEITKRKN